MGDIKVENLESPYSQPSNNTSDIKLENREVIDGTRYGTPYIPTYQQTNINKDLINRYIKDPSTLYPGISDQDIMYKIGDAQSNWEKVGKAGLRIIPDIALKTVQSFALLGSAAISPFMETGFTYNNALVMGLSKAQEDLKKALPVYGSKRYDSESLLDNLGDAKFWTDDFVDGLSFLVSAYISGFGIGSVAKVGTAARFATTNLAKGLSSLSRGTGLLTEVGQAAANGAKVSSYGRMLANASKAMMKTNLTAFENAINYQTSIAVMSASESLFEGHDTHKTISEQLRLKNQSLPDEQKLTDKQINDIATDGARATTIHNFGLLMLTNQFDVAARLLKPKISYTSTLNNLAIKKLESKGTKLVRDAAGNLDDAGNRLLAKEISSLRKLDIIKETGKTAITSPFAEGFEEWMQYAFQKSAEDVANKKYDDGYLSGRLSGIIDNFANAPYTNEGKRSIFLGASLGMLGAVNTAIETKDAYEQGKALADELGNRSIAFETNHGINTAFDAIIKDTEGKKNQLIHDLSNNRKGSYQDSYIEEIESISNTPYNSNMPLKTYLDGIDFNKVKETRITNSYVNLGRELATRALAVDNIESLVSEANSVDFDNKLKDKVVGDVSTLSQEEIVKREKAFILAKQSYLKGINIAKSSFNLINNQARFSSDINYVTVLALANFHASNEIAKDKIKNELDSVNKDILSDISNDDVQVISQEFLKSFGIDLPTSLNYVAGEEVVNNLAKTLHDDKTIPDDLKEAIQLQIENIAAINKQTGDNLTVDGKKVSPLELKSRIKNSPGLNRLLYLYSKKAINEIYISGINKNNSDFAYNPKTQATVEKEIHNSSNEFKNKVKADFRKDIESKLGTNVFNAEGKVDSELFKQYFIANNKDSNSVLNTLTSLLDLANNKNIEDEQGRKLPISAVQTLRKQLENVVKELINEARVNIRNTVKEQDTAQAAQTEVKTEPVEVSKPATESTVLPNDDLNKALEMFQSYSTLEEAQSKLTDDVIPNPAIKGTFLRNIDKISKDPNYTSESILAARDVLINSYKAAANDVNRTQEVRDTYAKIANDLSDLRTIISKVYFTAIKLNAAIKTNTVSGLKADILSKFNSLVQTYSKSANDSNIEQSAIGISESFNDVKKASDLYEQLAVYSNWNNKVVKGKVVKYKVTFQDVVIALTSINGSPLTKAQLATLIYYHNIVAANAKVINDFPITVVNIRKKGIFDRANKYTNSVKQFDSEDIKDAVDNTFETRNIIVKTGGINAMSIFMPIIRDITYTTNDNGDFVLDEEATELHNAIASLKEGNSVTIKVNKDFRNNKGQSFSTFENDLSKIPVHILVNGIEIGFIPTLDGVINHNGLSYELSNDTSNIDWTSYVTDEIKATGLLSNLKVILDLFIASKGVTNKTETSENYKDKVANIVGDIATQEFIKELINTNPTLNEQGEPILVTDLSSVEAARRISHIGNVLTTTIPFKSIREGSVTLNDLQNAVKDWRAKLARDLVNYTKVREFMFHNQDTVLNLPIKYTNPGDVAYKYDESGNEILDSVLNIYDVKAEDVDLYIVQGERLVNPITKEVVSSFNPKGYKASVFVGVRSLSGVSFPFPAFINVADDVSYNMLLSNDGVSYKNRILNDGLIKLNTAKLVDGNNNIISQSFIKSPNSIKGRNKVIMVDTTAFNAKATKVIEEASPALLKIMEIDSFFRDIIRSVDHKKFTQVKSIITEVVVNGGVNVDLSVDVNSDSYAYYNKDTKTIRFGRLITDETSSKAKAAHLLHEFIHASINYKKDTTEGFTESFTTASDTFWKATKSKITDDVKSKLSEQQQTDLDLIISEIDNNVTELYTYGLTHPLFHTILSSMESETGVKSKSRWNDFLDFIRDIFNMVFNTPSVLDEMVGILDKYLGETSKEQIITVKQTDVTKSEDVDIKSVPDVDGGDMFSTDIIGDGIEFSNVEISEKESNNFANSEKINYIYNIMENTPSETKDYIRYKLKYC